MHIFKDYKLTFNSMLLTAMSKMLDIKSAKHELKGFGLSLTYYKDGYRLSSVN